MSVMNETSEIYEMCSVKFNWPEIERSLALRGITIEDWAREYALRMEVSIPRLFREYKGERDFIGEINA